MKFNNIFKGAAVIATSALMLTGCASDYLDTPHNGSVDANDITKTVDNARAATLAVCGATSLYWAGGAGGPFAQGEVGINEIVAEFPGPDCYTGYFYENSTTWAPYYNQQNGFLNTGQYNVSSYMWEYCYSLIAECNEIIAGIDGAEGDEQAREYSKGEIYTMRAHLYFRLLQSYGPRWQDSKNGEALTVPNRNSVTSPQDLAAAPMNEILDQCYNDLDIAIEAFGKAGNFDRSLTYEPDLNVCYGVYARIAALKNDWKKCREMANKARQGYRPATTNEAMSGYAAFNTNEWMWAPSFLDVDNAIYGNWCVFWACNGYGASNNRFTSRIDLGLYRQIPEEDARRDWWMTADKLDGINPAMIYNPRAVSSVNQQFNATNLVRAARTWLDEHQQQYSIAGDKAYNGTGTGEQGTAVMCDGAQVKFWCDGLTGENARCQVPLMRATEMYLYEAEACAMLGLTGDAQALLNEINKPHNPSYNCTATGQALIDEIRLYRRIELWGEGFCWYDFKRWNIPCQRSAWVANDVNSGNIPAELCALVPVENNNGWRHGIPYGERLYNMAVPDAIPGETIMM